MTDLISRHSSETIVTSLARRWWRPCQQQPGGNWAGEGAKKWLGWFPRRRLDSHCSTVHQKQTVGGGRGGIFPPISNTGSAVRLQPQKTNSSSNLRHDVEASSWREIWHLLLQRNDIWQTLLAVRVTLPVLSQQKTFDWKTSQLLEAD